MSTTVAGRQLPEEVAKTTDADVEWRELAGEYAATRALSEQLCEPLEIEDFVVQSSPDVSPVKWHLAHTTWFFETFLLAKYARGYRPYRETYRYLFNSYYQAVGPRHARPERGYLSRPTVREVMEYRRSVDQRMDELFARPDETAAQVIAELVRLGINHEQQHQELLLTDLKHNFWMNPLKPAYRVTSENGNGRARTRAPEIEWIPVAGGVHTIGHRDRTFCFDNERPAHQVYLRDFQLGNRLVTNGEYLEFMQAGGYREPRFWLADGWDWLQREGIVTPLYWQKNEGTWMVFQLSGLQDLDLSEPVCHVSYYEAEAFAAWKDARLATEEEWEIAALATGASKEAGNMLETNALQTVAVRRETDSTTLNQMFGDVWEWTNSAYLPYPGYRPAEGALGEYNGKFMSGQMVLRGGSCVTPSSHIRATYRNFFQPYKRWQFTGIRLAERL